MARGSITEFTSEGEPRRKNDVVIVRVELRHGDLHAGAHGQAEAVGEARATDDDARSPVVLRA
jgi:hypothetical protein